MLGNNLFNALNLIVTFVIKFQDMKRPMLPQNFPNVYSIKFIILLVFTQVTYYYQVFNLIINTF